MKIAIIILTALAIILEGHLNFNLSDGREFRMTINWAALVDLILIIIYFSK